jgi:uncharacterized protein YdaU (DUF1376 family)
VNYVEFHLGDYMRDTVHLSMLEDAAYRRLLDAYYIRERPLPGDLHECFKLSRAVSKPEREAVAYVLKEFFQQREDGYHQRRADSELERYLGKRRKAKESAEARWNKCDRNADAADARFRPNANALRSDSKRICESDALQSPIINHHSPIKDRKLDRAATHPVEPDQFELLKAIYPKRAGSQRWEDAKKACNARLREGYIWQQILDGAQRYQDFCRHTGKERTETVLQAATFCGQNKEFENPWEIPATKADNQRDANVQASIAWANGTH